MINYQTVFFLLLFRLVPLTLHFLCLSHMEYIKNLHHSCACVFGRSFLVFRPVTHDPSHHQFNSDRSQLTIRSVARADYGEYICTAANKIAEDSATIMLHVFGWFDFIMLLV